MSDGLRSVLEAAITSEETNVQDTPVVEAPALETPVADTPQEVSRAGTQVDDTPSSEAETNGTVAKDAVEKPANIEEVIERPATEVKEVVIPPLDRAPASWKGDAKKVWADLPLQAKQEVLRRERDITKGLQESAAERQQFAAVREAIAPHMDRINHAHGGNPIAAISNMLNVERVMYNGSPAEKAQLVANMVKHFKVDIGSLDAMLVDQPIPQDQQQLSHMEQLLNQKLAPIMSFYEQTQAQQRQQAAVEEREAIATVESMAVDPDYPYFDELRGEMIDIIDIAAKRGVYVSVKEAYDKAVRLNDDMYHAHSARTSSQDATQVALAAHQEAQKAKGAAVSVSGNPSGNGTNYGNPSDLRGTIESALGRSEGRV